MKFNVKKVTSVTLLASMMLTFISPPVMPAVAQEAEKEIAAPEKINTEGPDTVEIQAESIEAVGMEAEAIENEEPSDEPASQPEPAVSAGTEAGSASADAGASEETAADASAEAAASETGSRTETASGNETVPGKDVVPKSGTDGVPVKDNETGEGSEAASSQLLPVQVHMSLETPDMADDESDPRKAGSSQKIRLSAENPSQEDAELRLYFWDYDGIISDGSQISREVLVDVCEDFRIPKCMESGAFPISLTDKDSSLLYGQAVLHDETCSGITAARYLDIDLPAGCSLEETFQVLNEKAETVAVSPVILPAELEPEQEYEKCFLTWNEIPEKSGEADNGEVYEPGEEMPEETPEAETEAQKNAPEAETDQENPVEAPETDQPNPPQEAETEDSEEMDLQEHTAELDSLMEALLTRFHTEDFASRRLLVLTRDESIIRDQDVVISSNDGLYVLEYETVEECMTAFAYYEDKAEAVEPDAYMEIASDGSLEVPSDQGGTSIPWDGNTRIIALLDTGTSPCENVIERVSLIDDALEGHPHGDQMVKAILSQNPDAGIMSVRVIGNDGRGTVSDIIAGMDYAMEHGASIINLSLSSRKNVTNSVLEAEIQKAVSLGYIVVGAAGNNASDVMDYMPGAVEEAYIIGACNDTGTRIASSNFGSTVDYNVTAATTSEAAARFSGCLSLAGPEGLNINEGPVYAPDYVASAPEETPDEAEIKANDEFTEEELADMAGNEEDGEYPARGSSISQTVKIWARDTEFDCASYDPYEGDEKVSSVYDSEIMEVPSENNRILQAEFRCSLTDQEDHYWTVLVTFIYVDDRSLATAGSSMLERLMPEMVNQDRNAGYGGIVPAYTGETVAGREFTVLKDDKDFDPYGLLIDYDPETFKVNRLADDGGFDVSIPGTYTITYEMSYFLYPEYTWFVANRVNVVDKESLEPGIYLTSKESTLMFKREGDSHLSGYGDLVRIYDGDEIIISCIDPEYEIDLTSSSESISADICTLTDRDDGTKLLTAAVPQIQEAVILSMYRPGYQSAKFFTGGGWANGDKFNIDEYAIDQLSAEDMDHMEDTILGRVDENDEEYMEIAESWTNVETRNFSGRVATGAPNTTNYSWAIGAAGGCNTATAMISEKKAEIDAWLTSKGYDINTATLTNFSVNCCSGHDYLALWPYSSYNVTLMCYVQKSGTNYRLKITCSLQPGGDDHGNYQGFYGSMTYSAITSGARIRVYKRFNNPQLMDENPNMYGILKTTFAIYPASAYNKTTKVLDTTVTPESTIIIYDSENDSEYGDSDILDPGTYYMIETRRIAGCTLNTDIYGPIVITDTDSGVIPLHHKISNVDYDSMAANNWIYNYPMYFSGKILTKTDDSGLPVAGAVYQVTYSNETTADAFKAYKTWYLKTDENGVLSYDTAHYVKSFSYDGKTYNSDDLIMNVTDTWAILPFGFLKIKEVMPPSDIYSVDTNTYTVELAAQKDAAGQYTIRKLAVKGSIPVSVDSIRYWKLTVNKQSKAGADVLALNGYSLAGARFAVYTDKECTSLAQLYTDSRLTSKVSGNVFVTDASGKAPEYYLKAGSGTATFYVKELTAPKGHQLAAAAVAVTVKMPDDALKLKTASFTGDHSEPYDTMQLDVLAEKLSMHGNAIKGVVFKVCFYDDTTANAAKLKKTWYLASDADGKVLLDQAHVYSADASLKSDSFYTDPSTKKIILPVGGYVTVQEVRTPAEYKLDDTVTGFKTATGRVTTKRLYNQSLPCRIRLKKYDQTGDKALEGVEFEIRFVKAAEKDTAQAASYTRLLKEGETRTMATDKNGEIRFENLDQGTYEITEVRTLSGQTLLKEKITVELPIRMTKAEADRYGNVDFGSAREDTGYSGKWYFYDCLYEITNEPRFNIPQTGGGGGWKYGFIGMAALMITAGAVILRRRRLISD